MTAPDIFTRPIDLISHIDLTSLNLDDSDSTIIDLCQKAITPYGPVAAICIYPKYLKIVSLSLKDTTVKIATVINFPDGTSSLTEVINEIKEALKNGANEIDMVFPYQAYINNSIQSALEYVTKARELCKNGIKLKVIIESGELSSSELVKRITTDAIRAGADFIKTSTGKKEHGATLEAATVILETIKELAKHNRHPVGIKISGGIRTIEQAESYFLLASKIMGDSWVNPDTFRIGASKLLDAIINTALI